MGHYSGQMRTYLLLLTILTASSVNGQRAPVRYIPIDSISIVSSGQDVKLDFKGRTKNNGRVPTAYPWLRTARPTGTSWTGDTVYLTIGNERIEFIEKKGLGVDYYYFPAERLESTTYKKEHYLTIPNSQVKEISHDSISFRLTVELDKKKGNGKWKQLYSRTVDLWIKKSDLDGVLISELGEE